MADDNRPLKYARYAIGEIILVVIGILIALQINNWNEERKDKIIGNQLANKLYEEILNSKKSIEVSIVNLDRQISLIDQLLLNDINSDSDLLLSQNQDYWPVQKFSLTTYFLFFTEVYSLPSQQYNSAISDGTINLISSTEFIEILESIHLSNAFYEKLLLREIESNDKIEEYIANNFSDIYNERKITSNGNWDLTTSKELIKKIWTDGGVKFLLQQKQTKLKSKKLILRDLVLHELENGINTYENLYLNAD